MKSALLIGAYIKTLDSGCRSRIQSSKAFGKQLNRPYETIDIEASKELEAVPRHTESGENRYICGYTGLTSIRCVPRYS